MAFIKNKKPTTSSTNSDSWRASAFLNINLVGRTNVKLGAIALRKSNASESKILSWIAGDSVKASTLKDKFILTYNAVGQSDTGLDFLDDIQLDSDDKVESDVIGYINIALPTATGSARLSSIALRHGNQIHEKLAAWLEQDEANIEVMKDKMNVVYQSAQGKSNDWSLD